MLKRLTINPSEYHLIELLGEGLNSCVYRAIRQSKEVSLDCEVALKLLKSRTDVQAWRQEVEGLMGVRSPYCLSIFGWEVVGDHLGIVSEYIKGVTLTELTRRESISYEEVCEIVLQAQQGLFDLAENGYCHGDVSPNNLMIDEKGRIIWIDYGKPASRFEFTPEYAAPETLLGAVPDYRSDLFGLGIIAVNLVGGDQRKVFLECLSKNNPGERVGVKCERSKEAVKTLAARVKNCLSRRCRGGKTVRLSDDSNFVTRPKFGSIARIFRKTAAGFVVVVLAGVVKATPSISQNAIEQSRLSIVTSRWVEIWLDGKREGYSPIAEITVKPGVHKLSWKTNQGTGEREIELGVGNHLVLSDLFFLEQTR